MYHFHIAPRLRCQKQKLLFVPHKHNRNPLKTIRKYRKASQGNNTANNVTVQRGHPLEEIPLDFVSLGIFFKDPNVIDNLLICDSSHPPSQLQPFCV
jgi:hypothetical protein